MASSSTFGEGLTRAGAPRTAVVDDLRGLMIVLMVLDHVRDFFHRTALTADPLAMDSGDPALFLTRWVTHLCAPTFVVLSGVSIWLQLAAGKSRSELSRSLLLRGLWLVALELTIVGMGFNFGPWLFFQVIWALGVGFLMMAALVHLGRGSVALLCGALLLLNPLLMLVPAGAFGHLQPFFAFGLMASEPVTVLVAYPVVPWMGFLVLGYLAGPLFTAPSRVLEIRLIGVALGGLAAFGLLRWFNVYGLDYRPWEAQPTGVWTVFSFMNVSKYPPSILYALLTVAIAAGLCVLLQRLKTLGLTRPLGVFGRTALVVYIAHIWIAHGLAMTVGMIQGLPASAFLNHLADPGRLIAAGWGFGLGGVYLFWLLTLAILWPLAHRYDRLKRGSRNPWLAYL